jgi:hypothetical protein
LIKCFVSKNGGGINVAKFNLSISGDKPKIDYLDFSISRMGGDGENEVYNVDGHYIEIGKSDSKPLYTTRIDFKKGEFTPEKAIQKWIESNKTVYDIK